MCPSQPLKAENQCAAERRSTLWLLRFTNPLHCGSSMWVSRVLTSLWLVSYFGRFMKKSRAGGFTLPKLGNAWKKRFSRDTFPTAWFILRIYIQQSLSPIKSITLWSSSWKRVSGNPSQGLDYQSDGWGDSKAGGDAAWSRPAQTKDFVWSRPPENIPYCVLWNCFKINIKYLCVKRLSVNHLISFDASYIPFSQFYAMHIFWQGCISFSNALWPYLHFQIKLEGCG